MTNKHTGDLHCHLNGSFSLAFLEHIAKKNNCVELYEELIRVRSEYLKNTIQQPESGYSNELIAVIWKQFGLVHKIIQTLADISDGVVDVVRSSKAKYLEIRTTPKEMEHQTRDKYIDAFVSGLTQANQQITHKKAVGLLSLDRTIHTLEDANYFIDRILKSPNKVLVGLDVSGNPVANRTLAGEDLTKLVHLALDKGIAIAIHVGESDSARERQDTDAVLTALEQWKSLHSIEDKNPLHGKVRLGHCIFLTQEQKDRIKKLGIPIEVCPSCHSKLNWHLEKEPHPATSIYQDLSEPIVLGTDDELIFDGSVKDEFNRLLSFFANKEQLSRKQLKEHQSSFRFSNN
ncbi:MULTISPECIES: amidohydrolase family protein [unclassified Legionella]|uniref:hypothetical protein n=1 Tax=Legionella sp. PC997 TaxID=2755562 RepID=UPI0015FD042B|nr:hypothetical protein [Legionella sp. PC997]QMT60089.1 Adenosine deaminase [Legionella sp. PC997]